MLLAPIVLGPAELPPDVLKCDWPPPGILDPKVLPAMVVKESTVVSKIIEESDEDSPVVLPSSVVTIETPASVLLFSWIEVSGLLSSVVWELNVVTSPGGDP